MNPKQLTDFIKSRRSIRKWKPDPVPKDIIDEIIECGKHAPSSFDAQPWEFIVLTDQEKISELLSDRLQLKQPPYDINSAKYVDKNGRENYEPITPPPALLVLYGNKEDCPYLGSMLCSLSTCAQNILLAIHAHGLGGCWLYVYDPDTPDTEVKIRSQLNLSDNHQVLCLIPFGYPNETPIPKKVKPKTINYQ